MLKKMRLRLIMSAILAFFAVIVFVSALVNITNYIVVTKQADESLSFIAEFENLKFNERKDRYPDRDFMDKPGDVPDDMFGDIPEGMPDRMPGDGNDGEIANPFEEDMDDSPMELPPMAPFFGKTNPESTYTTRFFSVHFDQNGEVVSTSTDNIVSVSEEDAIEYATKIYKGRSDHGYMKGYRYIKVEGNGRTTVVFLNMVQDLHDLRMLILETVVVALGSLAIVSILVIIISKAAIKPISKNIERQKQFITDASHELKTPLTSIMTSLDVLDIEIGENEWLDNIRSQSSRMSKLVSGLVLLSRLDEEIPLPNKESFSLSNAAWEIVEVYQSHAKAKEKNLKIDIKDDITIVGEKNAIQQMLSVLLDNAIRYSTGEGDIVFSVSKSRNKAIIEISNECEIDREIDVERLFDRFYRPDDSRNTNSGGTGIGMAIAKAVAETHGGEIKASCPNGTRMTIKVTLLKGKHL